MTNCLFAHGIEAVTGMLTVRYRHPVSTDQPVRVRAWIADGSDDLFLMASELQQAERVAVTAKGKFARRP
jgi:acyl-CoA thioesterase FadM